MSGLTTQSPPKPLPPPAKDGDRIRRMFAEISSRYDLLNHLLSLNVDRAWRRKAVRALDPKPTERFLDLCTGTADLSLAIAERLNQIAGGAPPRPGQIVGTDFCPEMVRIGETKRRARGTAGGRLCLAVADSQRLPFPEASFDGVTVAFGIRNVASLDLGLAEMLRVLRPGGRAVILEFTTPRRRWFRALFGFYFQRVLPAVGRWISGSRGEVGRGAYSYLPASVAAFPDALGFARRMEQVGFASVRHQTLSLGIACLHVGVRPGPDSR